MTLQKLVFTILLLTTFGGLSGQAPEKFSPDLAIGFRQGYQFSRIAYDPAPAQGLHQGITSGLVLQYLSQAQLGIQLEVNYSQRGLSAPELGQPATFRRDLDYIEIPLMTHFAIGKKSFRLVLNAGSFLSFLINNKLFSNGDPVETFYLLPVDRKWGYGLIGGLGFALRSRIGVFQIETRGAQGLTDLLSTENQNTFNASPEQFFGGQFSYLYRFGLKKKTSEIIPDDNSTGNL